MSQMKLPTTASSSTECRNQPLLFQDLGSRKVVADFSGGTLSSDGGVLFLRQVDSSLGLTRRLAACFGDQRHQVFVEHSVPELLAQRLYADALGYEDLNDHQQLRHDPLLATACGKKDPLGQDRLFHPGPALAGPSTLNRLELSNNKNTRCHKLPHDPEKIQALLVEMGARCLPKHAVEIVIDLDAMGHRLHGSQEGRHFSGYYDDYVYLPLYAFVGNIPLWAQLRTSDHGADHGVVGALEQMVAVIRRRCPKARILIRADSGFGHDPIMTWCESQPGVYYCLGLAKNSVLLERADKAMMDARARHCLTGAVRTRVFTEFEYQTTKGTWSR
ncbi:MAG TPA: IS1380 family transposase, partial [Candidatus Dormibacteraeota bacterium]|nr:IS1380 family transposase [Candidatus Dormibacteraeota bacterium]